MPRARSNPHGPALSIVGLGYVGLSTAICFADRGFEVHGVELSKEKLEAISRGRVPFQEEGLQAMLRSALKSGRFHASSDYEAVQRTDVTYVAVGTPSGADGSIDLKYIRSSAESIGRQLASKRGYHIVVVKSTAVPGTTEGVVKEVLERESGKKVGGGFGLAANPEFLREGTAVKDTLSPDAIVIGSLDGRSKTALLSLYRKFYGRLPPVVSTTPSNAEMIKYAVNTFRATQLSFLNTLSNLCQTVPGMDVDEVAKGFGQIAKADPRYLKAGLGYGGSCLPKDVRALIAEAKKKGVDPRVLEASLSFNQKQPLVAVDLAKQVVGSLGGKKLAVLGLAFKANTDDTRESTAISLVNALVGEGADVWAYDPAAMPNSRPLVDARAKFAKDAKDCLRGAECCFVATAWPEFVNLGPKDYRSMARPQVVDCRGALDLEWLRRGGVRAVALGKGAHPDRQAA